MLKSQSRWRWVLGLVAFGISFGIAFAVNEATANAESSAKTHIVEIRNSAFLPRTLTIKAGDTVIWKNRDIVPHTATGKAFDTGNLDSGQSGSYVAKRKGNYSYICTYHPSMKGTIIVK